MAQGIEPGHNGPATQQGLSIVCTGKQGPIPEGAAVHPCPACYQPLLPGQFFTMLPIGPGGDPRKRAAARHRLPYGALYIMVHWADVSGDESESKLAI